MQFRVPQFIDLEDKVFGPLTLKQFGYIVGAGGFSFLIWTFIPIKFIAILVIIPVAGLFLSLAFVKYNNRSFGELLESALSYYTGSKIFTWRQPQAAKVQNSAFFVVRLACASHDARIVSELGTNFIDEFKCGSSNGVY